MGVIENGGSAKLAFFASRSGRCRAGDSPNNIPNTSQAPLDAFVWTGKDAPTLAQRAKNLEPTRRQPPPGEPEFYESVFTPRPLRRPPRRCWAA